MDAFEEKMNEMQNLTEEEYEQQVEDMKLQCTCPNCPSYNDCAKKNDELLYCALGKSEECIENEKECICPDCPVSDKMGLKHMFFCTRDTEKEQRE